MEAGGSGDGGVPMGHILSCRRPCRVRESATKERDGMRRVTTCTPPFEAPQITAQCALHLPMTFSAQLAGQKGALHSVWRLACHTAISNTLSH